MMVGLVKMCKIMGDAYIESVSIACLLRHVNCRALEVSLTAKTFPFLLFASFSILNFCCFVE